MKIVARVTDVGTEDILVTVELLQTSDESSGTPDDLALENLQTL